MTEHAPAPARVTVYRTHADDVRQRQVIVRIGDGPRHQLVFGESFTEEVPAGHHLLRGHNTLVKRKLEFDAAPGEHVEIDAINRSSKVTLGFLSLLGVAPLFLELQRRVSRPLP
jgi:hypothetical protein